MNEKSTKKTDNVFLLNCEEFKMKSLEETFSGKSFSQGDQGDANVNADMKKHMENCPSCQAFHHKLNSQPLWKYDGSLDALATAPPLPARSQSHRHSEISFSENTILSIPRELLMPITVFALSAFIIFFASWSLIAVNGLAQNGMLSSAITGQAINLNPVSAIVDFSCQLMLVLITLTSAAAAFRYIKSTGFSCLASI